MGKQVILLLLVTSLFAQDTVILIDSAGVERAVTWSYYNYDSNYFSYSNNSAIIGASGLTIGVDKKKWVGCMGNVMHHSCKMHGFVFISD